MDKNLVSKVEDLFERQLKDWTLAKTNYDALATVKTKEFVFDGFKIKVQFNPARIVSSSAKVDAKSIQARKCFLCPANLPQEQEGIDIGEYQILVNPFPIFQEHFTIPTFEHTDQLLLDRFADILDIAKQLNKYTLFYNGPKCGASAPDHAHFQACARGYMPIENEMESVAKEKLIKEDNSSLNAVRNYNRNMFLIQSSDKKQAVTYFKKLYALLDIKDGESEPMMNVIMWYINNQWNVCVIPREKHRPDCYYAEGDANILISPGSVDLGGLLIIPQEKDFDKITAKDIESILKEICLDDTQFQKIIDKL